MKLALRILRLVPLAIWVGGTVFFIVVAGVSFKVLPTVHEAALVVRGSLLMLHRLGLIAGALYLFFTLALLATQGDSHPARAAEIVLAVSMMGLTLYLQQSVLPHMETDRLTLGGDVSTAPAGAPAHLDFDRLHVLSTRVEGAILIEGLLLLCLTPVYGRDHADRYA